MEKSHLQRDRTVLFDYWNVGFDQIFSFGGDYYILGLPSPPSNSTWFSFNLPQN